jgi:hypothetical protein
MEPFMVMGTWWFPDRPDLKFDAKLDYDFPQGATLTPTSGEFMQLFMERYGRKYGSSLRATVGGATYEVPMLIGVGEGRQFSLLHCHLHPSGVEIGLIVKGAHFDNADTAIFPAYSLSYSGLDEWGASGRLQGFLAQYEDGRNYFELSYETPPSQNKPLTIELENVFIEIRYTIAFPGSIRNRAALTESAEFRIVPKPAMTVSATNVVDTYSNLLRNFLMLATWNYVTPLYLRGWNEANDSNKGQAILYWRGKGMGLPLPQYSDDWLFTLAALGEHLTPILQAWEDRYDQFKPLIRNYFSHRYLPENYLEVRFLAYMQALEGYHKRLKPNLKVKYTTKSGMKKERDLSLKERLVDLLNSLQRFSVVSKITGCNLNAFAQPMVDLRNELSHEADLTISWIELARYTNKLELIILLSIYNALGFPYDLVEQISVQNIGFQTRMH